MPEWLPVVRRELARYREQTGYDVVELQELYDQMLPVLEAAFPNNDHPKAKLRQRIQRLGKLGEVEFVDNDGTYRILTLDDDRAPPLGESASDASASSPADSDATDLADVQYTAAEYETTVGARSIPRAFRDAILDSYGHTCPVSGVDHDRLLDVAHVLPWSDHPDRRTDPGNVLPLSKTHHAAFDAGLFTLDADLALHAAPDFETDCDHLRRTVLDRDGSRLDALDGAALTPALLDRRNETLDWW